MCVSCLSLQHLPLCAHLFREAPETPTSLTPHQASLHWVITMAETSVTMPALPFLFPVSSLIYPSGSEGEWRYTCSGNSPNQSPLTVSHCIRINFHQVCSKAFHKIILTYFSRLIFHKDILSTVFTHWPS